MDATAEREAPVPEKAEATPTQAQAESPAEEIPARMEPLIPAQAGSPPAGESLLPEPPSSREALGPAQMEALEPETAAPAQMEALEAVYPEEDDAPPKRVRPEWIMGLMAILAAALLLTMVALCLPYFSADEDPEPLAQRHNPAQATQGPRETLLEPTAAETEPENLTIPPDPNPYDRYDFQYNRHNFLLLQNLNSYPGIDVSAYQGKIDWEAVACAGVDFAIIRLGYRGYGSGKLVEDEYARRNLTGAKDAGLKVGAYFFSQALTIQETDEEIQFMRDILGEQYLDMPIVLDWEIPYTESTPPRTAGMDARTLTDIQLHFCQVMEELGYQPMVYFNWHQSETLYYLSELEGAPFWLALYQDRMTYPWKVEMWQYSDKGRVPGIDGYVDLNVYMPD